MFTPVNTNPLYQGEFPVLDQLVNDLVEAGVKPEYWGVLSDDQAPGLPALPYVYLHADDHRKAYRLHEVAVAACHAGFNWDVRGFFPGNATRQNPAVGRKTEDLRYCLALKPMLEVVRAAQTHTEVGNAYRLCASQFFSQELAKLSGARLPTAGDVGSSSLG